MRKLALPVALLTLGLAIAGCGDGDTSDPEAARIASEQAPKTPDQLPANMPPQARAAAEAAMAQNAAMQAQADKENKARMAAMAAMQKGQK